MVEKFGTARGAETEGRGRGVGEGGRRGGAGRYPSSWGIQASYSGLECMPCPRPHIPRGPRSRSTPIRERHRSRSRSPSPAQIQCSKDQALNLTQLGGVSTKKHWNSFFPLPKFDFIFDLE